ncbi:MAG: hypothetical protein CMM60_03250 [Rhodospirillaceae bacterium]|jgi:3-oxoacyl-(acyl-carrier-protein) synthase|nr:hypothetical protein [Rhodospirillaceae bacterium]|tara:strand:+ start:548 stop:1129 length:582 start_codon:yes stop_codon:yes gene_type:complete
MKVLGKGFADKDDKIKGIRRADNFAKMSVIASKQACLDFEFKKNDTNIAIIVSTQFGPHATTFKFLDNLIDYSDTAVSPLTFSHSVHNAAASYIASQLEIRGQSLTMTTFEDPLRQALILADSWLELKQAEKILLCYIDEESIPLNMIHGHCAFPTYSKNKLVTRAASLLLKTGNDIIIPEKIFNPFKFIEEL